ncbi:MAG: hypothetical protein R6U37_08680 [Dehalococcoidia bacterium]
MEIDENQVPHPKLTGDYATDRALWDLSLILREIASGQSPEIIQGSQKIERG